MAQKVLLLLLGLLQVGFAQSVNHSLISGEPIKNGASGGVGHFAQPSLTGMVMGTALANNDAWPDLFLQSDKLQPGTFLYHFSKFSENGTPVFSQGIKLKLPFEDTGENKAVVLQNDQKKIFGLWRFGKSLKMANFNSKAKEFAELKTIKVEGLPGSFSSFGVVQLPDGRYLFLFTIAKKGVFSDPSKGADSSYFTPEGFWPFDLQTVGIYGALADDIETLNTVAAKPLTGLDEAYFTISGYSIYTNKDESYIICGTRLGNIHAYKLDTKKGVFLPGKYIANPDHIIQRHPSVHAYPAYFKVPGGKEGIIASGEGGICFYENNRQKDKSGNLIFQEPRPLLQESPLLYGGSLVVPNLTDWDGDGILDLISGNSLGHILFFKNSGTNEKPTFQSLKLLQAGGYDIHVQPGYREDIQGPMEARWGYTCPTVYDWNGDGLPDILTGDSRGKFMIYINKGTKAHPKLEPERSLYVKGMNVFGGWRVKPGVSELNGKTAYIILDRENEFHLYWRLDDYNISDGGKLTLTDGSYIKANRRPGGQVGRAKVCIVDWDGDGKKDLLIGTGRSASIPNPVSGLPYNRKKKNEGAAVLFLRNTGSDEKPVFEFPKMMKFKGNDILLGAHSCSPTAAKVGPGNSLNLVVGTEYGTYMFYQRKDLSW
ncbi:FG-GAP repeat domain-containing protein [Desertivirga xinjiangensis]|uniref:FG-GAP repeat domain-containing protein n=1 Tax=Desertivirga xinjiangensis TaxID=539206 RepID=UPI00210DD01E|nr:VCBS repeat-containing protein [Pedobacter xinjiangensis]